MNHGDGPLASRVLLEDPWHPVGTFLVEDHRANFATLGRPCPGVDIAERRGVHRASTFCLLKHAFARLSREVSAVELGDRTHDAVQQHAAWRLINVLGTADELSASFGEFEIYLHVIDSVAGQTVNFVHDDRVNAALELRPVGRASTLACINKLFDDLHTKTVRFP